MHRMRMRVVIDTLLLNAAAHVHIRDRPVADRIEIFRGIDADISRVGVQVGQVQQERASRLMQDLRDKLDLRHLRVRPIKQSGDVF